FGDRTVLALSSSDPYGLPGTGDRDDAMAMIRELSEYLKFKPGSAWGQSPDIDWKRTRYDPNDDAQLFINQAGSDVWRPSTRYAWGPYALAAKAWSESRELLRGVSRYLLDS